MNISDWIESLKIPGKLESLNDGKYKISLKDSNEFAKVYSKLENSDLLDIDEEATLITEDISQLLYLGKNIRINLVGNFEKDIYYIIISEEERKNNER